MTKKDCIVFIVDNFIYIETNKNKTIHSFKFENYIFDGRVVKPKALSKRIQEYLKKEKILRLFTTLSVDVIYNPHLKYIDKKTIIDLFENIGFKDIKLYSTLNLLDNKKIYLEINNNYIIKYYSHKYVYIPLGIYCKVDYVVDQILKKEKSDIFLLGISSNIPDIAQKNKTLYYYNDSAYYYINRIIKKTQKN